MGLNGFTEWLFSALLSWMQIIYNWLWSMLASGGQNEFMPWFSDNWLKIVLILIIVGLVVDYTIYLMRWQPYHVWLTTLRRARGYVSRPFTKEQPRMRYAGYRRVLEGCEGEEVGAGATGAAVATGASGAARRKSAGTYEARPRTQRAAGALNVRVVERAAAQPDARPVRQERSAYARRTDGQRAYGNAAEEYTPVNAAREYERPASVAAEEYAPVSAAREYERPASVAAEEYAPVSAAREYERPASIAAEEYAPVSAAREYERPASVAAEEYAPVNAAREYERPASIATEEYAPVNAAREYERPASVAAEEYAPVSATLADEPDEGMALDADGYVPETVSAPEEGEQLAFSEPPVFARSTRESAPVYGRAYQRPGQSFMPMGVESDTRPQVELPDMEGLDMLNGDGAAEEPERTARAQARAVTESLTDDTYETRRSARQTQAQRSARRYEGTVKPTGGAQRYEGAVDPAGGAQRYEGAVEPTGGARRYEGAVEPTGGAQRYEGAAKPAGRAAGAAGQTAPRSISVRETGITREIDFDDEID